MWQVAFVLLLSPFIGTVFFKWSIEDFKRTLLRRKVTGHLLRAKDLEALERQGQPKLIRRDSKYPKKDVGDESRHIFVAQYLVLLVVSYLVLRAILDTLMWRHHMKAAHEQLSDMLVMIFFALTIELFARVSRLIERLGIVIYGSLFVWHLAMYSIVYQNAPAAEFAANVKLAIAGTLLKYFAMLFIFLFFAQHIKIAREQETRFKFYVKSMALIVGIHFGVFFFLGHYVSIHIHHYYWATALACMARYDHSSSFAAQLILNAVMLHGFAAFGPDPVFMAPSV